MSTKSMNKVLSGALLLLTLSACGSRDRNGVAYAEDPSNGLLREVKAGDVTYAIQYKPAAYVIQQEHLSGAEATQRAGQLKGMAWFNIRISVDGFGQSPLRYKISGLEEYTQRQDYYLNRAPADLSLLYGSDTLRVAGYWFENNQNLTPYETIVVGFKLPDGDSIPVKDLQLSFYDRVFKNGIIKTVIKKDNI